MTKLMTEQKKISIIGRLFGIVAIAVIWFVVSFVLTLMLAGANDTMGTKATVPLWLNMAWGVALFPMNLMEFLMSLIGWNIFDLPSKYDRLGGILSIFFIFINSVLWGMLWSFLFRRVARFFATKNVGKPST